MSYISKLETHKKSDFTMIDQLDEEKELNEKRYLDYNGLLEILDQVLEKEDTEFYRKHTKESAKKLIIKFPARKLKKDGIIKASTPLACSRSGYSLPRLRSFYKLLFTQKIEI